jgi:hypothetical protein
MQAERRACIHSLEASKEIKSIKKSDAVGGQKVIKLLIAGKR